jgi:hypothetical protein
METNKEIGYRKMRTALFFPLYNCLNGLGQGRKIGSSPHICPHFSSFFVLYFDPYSLKYG